MADDINLPNLVSHLAVNLDGLQGTVADASRQGSSVGAALGGGIRRQLDDLLAHIPDVQVDANSDEADRDLARLRQELQELSQQRIGIDVPIDEALRRIGQLTPHLQRLTDDHYDVNVQAVTRQAAQQLDELLAAARRVDDTDVDIDVHADVDVDRPNQLLGILRRIPSVAGAAAGPLAGVGVAAAGIGAAVPLLAGVVSTLANVAPAAGVAVTGMAAVQLASGAVKLAAVGMDDALSAALDPSKAEEFNEALEKLSPEAAKFATVVRDAAPALRDMQQAVQDEVFRGLADELERTGAEVLPILRTNLISSGQALNDMARGVSTSARELAEDGTLGKALGSASTGLHNLSGIPGIVVKSLGQIAAAAGPSFERLTEAAAEGAAGISDKLSAAFESGQMQEAIEHAIDLLKQLFRVGSNVGEIIGGIFNAVPEGGGLIGVLEDVTGAIADIVNTAEVQDALRSLFEVMGTLGSTAASLLGEALLAIAPVFTELGPPVQKLIESLGEALSPVIKELGPVLESAGGAFGALIEAIAPIFPVLGQLIADFLPVLTPLFEGLREIFEALAPSIELIAETLGQMLSPILESLPELIQPLVDAFVQMAEEQGPLLADLLKELQPSFVKLGEAFGQVLEALGPLLPDLLLLGTRLFEEIAPHLPGLIDAFAELAALWTDQLVWVVEKLVIPALELLNALLSGDTPGATKAASEAIYNLNSAMATVWDMIVGTVRLKIGEVILWISGLPGRAASAMSGLATRLTAEAVKAGVQLVAAIRRKVDEAVSYVRGLPGRAAIALGGVAGVLRSAGASLISGFISGIRSQIPSIRDVLTGITNSLPDWKGPPSKDAKILTKSGQLLIQGFIKGINLETSAKLRSRLESITKALPDNVRKGIGKTLAKATAELEKLVAKRDSVLKKLAAGQKKLDDLVKARGKAASDITKGILDDADITSGRGDVNSVSAITVGLQQALKSAKEFQANISKLRSAGLRSDLLQQIADAGVDAGGATAAALAKATPAELKKINDLQAQLAKSATATGNTVGDALYGAGIRAAQGLVAGLKSQEKAIESQMRKIAEGMLKTVKKAHKTRSPSQEFRWIGEMDGQGLEGGLLASVGRVRAAAQRMAGAALDVASGVSGAIAGTPTAGQLSAVYAGAGGGDTTNNIYLYGSDATPAGIVRELSWLGLVGRR